MKINLPDRFLVIDDDPINNLLCTHAIKTISDETEIKCFTLPMEGIEFIQTNYKTAEQNASTILLLDLNMPVISGWEFLERFKTFEENIIKQFTIFILSSSVDDHDIKRAKEIPLVKDYIIKPLTPMTLSRFFDIQSG